MCVSRSARDLFLLQRGVVDVATGDIRWLYGFAGVEDVHGGQGTVSAFTDPMSTFCVRAVNSLPLLSEGDFGITRVFWLHGQDR